MKSRFSLIVPLLCFLLVVGIWLALPPANQGGSAVVGASSTGAHPEATLAERWARAGGDEIAIAGLRAEAEAKKDEFLKKIVTEPDAALRDCLSLAEHEALPEELKEYFPRPFSGRADLDQEWEVSLDDEGNRACAMRSVMNFEGERLVVHGTKRGPLPVLRDAPVAGARLGGHAVLADMPVVALSRADIEAMRLADSGVDPLTGRETDGSHAAWVAGQWVYFESAETRDEAGRMLAAAIDNAAEQRKGVIDEPFAWLAGDSGGDSGGDQATPYQQNQIDVLFIRVDFSDFPGEPVTKAALETTLASVNTHLGNYSYGQAGITSTVTTSLYRMPKTGATYAKAGDNNGIHSDARALVEADGINLANYDVVAVFFPTLSNVAGSLIKYGGLATIGGGNHWINGFNDIGVIAHEFGHNYGLYHANYYHPEQALGGTYELPGVLEYGDIFDLMGSGKVPEGHFNHLAKNQLQWMGDSKVVEATGDGEFTIYRFDHASATNNPTLAVKVPMSGNVNYWIGYRQLYPQTTYNLSTGAYVVGENMGEGRETSLIDMTPGSKTNKSEDRADAGLPVGSSYYNADAGVTIRALERGGTEPNQWIKVSVEFDARIRMAETLVEVDEQRGVARVQVERLYGYSGEVLVNYTTVAGTATSGTDYLPVSGTLHWGDGDESPRVITVPIKPDSTVENRETLTVQLSNAVGGVLDGGSSSTQIKILEPGQRYADFNPPFFNLTVECVLPLPDGKVLIGGTISNIGDATISNIARLNADGSLDTSFLTGSGFNGVVRVLRLQSDGKILVGGSFTSYNGTACKQIARLQSNGVLDTAFTTANGTGPNGSHVYDIAVESSGRILVGGDFDSFNGTASEGLVRLTSAGSRDSTNALSLPFTSTFNSFVRSIHVEPDNKIMAAGYFYISGATFRASIARLNTNGTRDTSFDPGAGIHLAGALNTPMFVYSIDRTHDGKYLACGFFSAYNGTARSNMVRILSTGAIDTGFVPPSFDSTVLRLAYQPGGKTLLAGFYSSPTTRFMRLGTDGSADSGFGPVGTTTSSTYTIAEGLEDTLFVGGNFFQYEGTTSRPVVKVASGISPYRKWQEVHFTGTELLAGQGGDDGDADSDGLSNLAEYAFGTNPRVAQATATEFAVGGDGVGVVEILGERYLQVSIEKSAAVDGTWYAAQFGSGLASWQPASPTAQANDVYEVVEDSATRYTVRDKTPLSGSEKRFARVHLLLAE